MGKSVQDLIDSGEIKNFTITTNSEPFRLDETVRLDLRWLKLESLNGIEKFENLDVLYCSENLLTSLKGIEKLAKLRTLYCSSNKLDSLEGIEKLVKLEKLYCSFNKLTSLDGVEKLINLKELYCYHNPCSSKYDGLSAQEIVKKVELESHLKDDDGLRGAASISDTGLFDFKIK